MITRGDKLIIVCAGLLLYFAFSELWTRDVSSGQARILSEGAEYAVVSLQQERVLRVPGPAGFTVVEVRDGAIRCAESPGWQQICQRAGWLRQGGEVAVSLPNRVVIQVLSEDPRYDAINF